MRAIMGKVPNSACKCPYKANGARWQRDAAWDILFKLQKRLLAPSSAVFQTVRTDAGDAEIKMPSAPTRSGQPVRRWLHTNESTT
jgi:hypothetical protein